MTRTLDDFQLEVHDLFAAAKGRAIYADPMGARKTGTTLSWLRGEPSARVLVVAPSPVHGHWGRQAAEFYPEARVFTNRGSVGQRHECIADALAWIGPSIYITTYAAMTRDRHELDRFDAIVFDEAHRLKGRRTQVALAANAITKDAREILCLTGTPVLNHPSELWQYLHMIDPKTYRSYWSWVYDYFIVEMRQFKGARSVTRLIHGFLPGAEVRLRDSLKGIMIQRDLVELFGNTGWAVEPEHVEIPVELSPSERRMYDKLVKDQWAKTPEGLLINAGNKLAVTVRLRQLASNWATFGGAHAGSKVKATTELVQDLVERGQVVIFAQFIDTVEGLVEDLRYHKVRAVAWTGNTPPDVKERALRDFARGQLQVIVGTIASLGEGVDGLQCAHQVVMVDRDWRHLINEQAVARCRRSGQEHQVTVYHVFAPGTTDESVHAANLRKHNFENTLRDRPLVDVLYGRHA